MLLISLSKRFRSSFTVVLLTMLGGWLGLVSASEADVAETQQVLDQWYSEALRKPLQVPSPLKLKFAHPAPPASLLPPVFQKHFDWINSVTRGAVNIKQYGGGALYAPKGGFKAIKAGVADYGMCYALEEKKGFELTRTTHVPLVMPTRPLLAARVLAELSPKYMAPEFERRGVHLGFMVQFRQMALMSKEPIRRPEDLKGKKVLSVVNLPGFAETFGFVKVNAAFPEFYTALQQGLADAVIWSDLGFIPFKIYEQAKYYTNIQAASPTLESCFNRRAFKSLPKAIKPLMAHSQQLMTVDMVLRGEQFTADAEGVYSAKGVEEQKLRPEETQAWQNVYSGMLDKWLVKCDAAKKDCRGLVKDIKALTEKYEGYSDEALLKLTLEQPVEGIIKY